jgi:hypothetical protein
VFAHAQKQQQQQTNNQGRIVDGWKAGLTDVCILNFNERHDLEKRWEAGGFDG